MKYTLRFLLYNRHPQPHYQPLGADMLVDEEPRYEPSKVYQLQLVGSTDDSSTWPEFVVIRTISQVQQQTWLTEVFVVLLSEQEQFVEPFQSWELN